MAFNQLQLRISILMASTPHDTIHMNDHMNYYTYLSKKGLADYENVLRKVRKTRYFPHCLQIVHYDSSGNLDINTGNACDNES